MLSNEKAVFVAQSNKSFFNVRFVSVVLINLFPKTRFNIISMVLFNGTLVKSDTISKETDHNLIQANTQTLHTLKHTNPNLLLFLEALYIKYRKPVLNIGLRASKELVVFS